MNRRVVRTAGVLVSLGLACAPTSCGSEVPAASNPTACPHVVWHKPGRPTAYVEIVGDWNQWARPGIVPTVRDDGYRVTELSFSPGEHKYAVLEDGEWLVDQHVATTAFHEGREVSLLTDVKCGSALNVVAVRVDATSSSIEAEMSAPSSALTISMEAEGRSLGAMRAGGPEGRRYLGSLEGLARGRHEIVLRAHDGETLVAETRTSVWVRPLAADKHDLIVYQAIVDRFRGDGGAALTQPTPSSARAGGTLEGLRAFIESGALTDLGFNALWVSPLYANPEGMWPGAGTDMYSSYHGYWPTEARAVDARLGGEASLERLVRAAHERGVAVIVDVVPNHVHQSHAYASRPGFVRKEAGCVCGAPGCDWARHIEDCWFAPYLPDLDWTNDEVARTVTADVRFWFDRFGVDGIRIDAVPMMPRAATRRMVHAIRDRVSLPPGDLTSTNVPLLLGENFTGPGGYGSLKYHLGPQGLDSQFHFPLMWALRGAIAEENQPLSSIADAVLRGDEEWVGSGAVMATMIGNHDVVRFASVSDGTANGDRWKPAPTPASSTVYAKQKLALSVIYTLPGMPVVYYGDELGLPGGGDPDSRRVMPASSAWSEEQRDVAMHTAALGRARACSPALRRGATQVIEATAERVVLLRTVEDDVAIVVWNRHSALGAASGAVKIPGISSGAYIDLLSGEEASLTTELTLPARPPFSAHVFVPKGAVCRR